MRNPTRLLVEMPQRLVDHSSRAYRAPNAINPRRFAIDVAKLNVGEIAYRARPFDRPVRLDGLSIEFSDYSALVEAVGEIFLDGIYAVDVAAPNPVIFDCGANIGLASMFLARRFPTASITAFEPDSAAFRVLESNVKNNFPGRIVCHQVALGARDGTVDFWYAPDHPGSMVGGLNARGGVTEKRSVQMRRLSSYIDRRVDLLKIDVEGGEDGILADLIATGRIDDVDAILLEYHHHLTPEMSFAHRLAELSDAGFSYQVASPNDHHVVVRDVFQDLLVYAYRPTRTLDGGQASVREQIV
jgi:FkbM family methyltransferase